MFKLDYLVNHPEHIQRVAELGLQEFGYLNPGQTLADRIIKVQSHLHDTQLPMTLVALQDNQVIGTTSLREYDIDCYRHVSPWLGSVIVVPELRNKGVGTQLVQETMKLAMKMDIPVWYLYTPNRENFYARMGWKTIDTATHNSVAGVIMQLK